MQYGKSKDIELKKLYDLLEKVKYQTLGSDYQTRLQLKVIKQKVIEKIQSIESEVSASGS